MPYNYSVNWPRHVVLNLQLDLRKIRLVRYALALIQPVIDIYTAFIDFRYDQIYQAKINGQVIKLELVLNDIFDNAERRIFITDGEYYDPPVFYEEYKNQPVIFRAEGDAENPVFYSITSLDDRISVNFYVNVPAEIFFERDRIRAIVNKYKIFGRTFEIIVI